MTPAWPLRRLAARFVPEVLSRPDLRQRAEFGVVLSLVTVLVAVARGLLFLTDGLVPQGLWLMSAALVAAALPCLLVRTASLFLFGNGLALLWWVALSAVAYARGGFGAPALLGLGLVPLLATFISSSRSGIYWTGLLLLQVVALSLITRAGMILHDQVPAGHRWATDGMSVGLFVLCTLSIALAYEGTTRRAISEAERAVAAEEEAKQARADRMEQVGQLAAAVAHEANNPLSYVIANLSFVRDRLGKTKPDSLERNRGAMDEALTEALSGADRVRRIVKDLKTFARDDEREPHVVDLGTIAAAAIRLTSDEVRRKARVETRLDPAPRVLGSENKFVQAFVNLVSHASESLAPGRAEANVIRYSLGTEADGSARIEVTAIGARATAAPPTVEPPPGSPAVATALGLAVAENVVTSAGGRLVAESDVDAGTTTVRVILPAAPEDVVRTLSSSPAPAAPRRSLRVLAIDDDPLVLKAIRRVLSAHQLTSTTRGREALTLLADDGNEFDVVLCDLMMPDLTGIDVYERASALGRGLEKRFVFLTGGAFTDETTEFLASARNLRIEKPFSPRNLENALLRVAEEQGSIAPAGDA